ncbi:alpha-amylase family glycosyl hydrolase [Flavisolibacter nicotianae]|uniref:alpha-amylase family glycosyl hydrolase n=1 Tax=Flavisolibacter nicotianae TaxID=2364882 RepID=UPI000EB320A0|nr:alpha-amylase family glycosyl hydrolase [Flavisolibacter nicotianae]
MQNWIRHTNIYEVNLRQYTAEGTIRAFAAHLPRLRDMGVETLWFMPITPIAQKNKKGSMGSYYACSDYTSVAEEFGTVDDFKNLVQQAHDMGFKVILDWVANHTGWDHWWTVEHPDWYEKDEHTGDFKKASGMDDIIELDFKNPVMRKAMIEAMAFWIRETGIDGFRADLAFWVELDFWQEARPELEKIKPMFWLGELDPLDNPEYMQVYDAAYTWRWMHKAEHFYKSSASFGDLLHVLDQYRQAPGVKAWFTANHDENTWNGTEYEKYGAMAACLAVFSCTWPGVPLLYSGQELPNHKRLQFFEKDVIEWRPQCDLHSFYKTLFALKKEHPALATDSELEIIAADEQQRVLAFRRKSGESEVVVLLNFSAEERLIQPKGQGVYVNVFTQEKTGLADGNGVMLQPWGFSVFAK